ncbi:major facilitator superfamily domain-containing protein [Aspergillus pseudotamarii]|uniref:Major facilitator superfamily domain-containing protein n=1 Tax=Aspergillus pseudotamarii TaxID=132259 RepID=A0A5N6SP49_ASPPS|nr:major facilitator superfamily domain-containing protein [Aspergillus pseudotamarii]KAE8136466.1 major facilitator superfamily domain-containing protein [Aspergillus pseudotamarii]
MAPAQQHGGHQQDTSGELDPTKPLTWLMRQKWVITIIASCFTLIPPVSSTMVAPALANMSADLGIINAVVSQLTFTIFMLAYAIGPLLLGPLSETIGRSPVLLASNVFFLAWTLGCGLARNKAELITFRFLAGIGGSVPLAVDAGVISDLWAPGERGQAVGIHSLAPLLSPVIGPLVGGAAGVVGFVFIRETYIPVLLKQRQDHEPPEGTSGSNTSESLATRLRLASVRPLHFFVTEPIITVVAIYMAAVFGVLYILLSTYPKVWTEEYDESPGIGGLNYISLGLGYILGSQINAGSSDAIYQKLKGEPEVRVPPMFVSSALIPIGMFWYGWSVQAHTHWIMPNVGSFIFSLRSITCIYAEYAASGLAAAVLLRNIAAFGIPLFAPYMYDSLHYGWGNSVLGFASVAIGIPSPFLFWIYEKKIRGMSKFAVQ